MSEAATSAAPSGATAAPSTAPASTASEAQGQGQNRGQSSAKAQGSQTQAQAGQAQGGKADAAAAAPAKATETAEELEEIKIGGAKGKVSKELARAMKELERGFHSKSQEMAAQRNYFQNLASQAKSNPLVAEALFEQLGIDPAAFSQAKLAKIVEQEMMNPDQRRAMELEARARQAEEQLKQHQERQRQMEQSQRDQVADRQLRQEVGAVLEKTTLPFETFSEHQKALFASQVISAKMRAEIQGNTDFTWDDARGTIEHEWKSVRGWISKLDPESAEKELGPDFFHKWREYDLKRVTGSATQQTAPKNPERPASQAASQQEKKSKQMTEAEWREWAKQA